jgi:hypothetical protein
VQYPVSPTRDGQRLTTSDLTNDRLKYYIAGPGLWKEIMGKKSHGHRVLSLAGSPSVHNG